MGKLQKIITLLMWSMVFVMPFWLMIGREFFGGGGWLEVFFLFHFVPALVVSLLIINISILCNWTYKKQHLVTKPQAIVLLLLYCFVFLYGVFVVDFTDAGSTGSIATRILSTDFEYISSWLSTVFFYGSIILLLLAFVVAVGGRFLWIRSWKTWVAIGVCMLSVGATSAVLYILHINDPAVKDEQISYDFRLLSQDIQGYALEHDRMLPTGSAQQLAANGKFSQETNVAKRADKYTYIPLQEKHQFKLCAIFNTDTMSNYVGLEGEPTNTIYHHAGYQCFTSDAL